MLYSFSFITTQNEQLLDPISKDPSKVVKQQVLLIAFEVVCGSTIFIIQVNGKEIDNEILAACLYILLEMGNYW